MENIFFVAYASSATKVFAEGQLVELLALARTRNSASDVTGLLLHRGGNFLQALEGPEAAVRDIMQRIARDTRHRSVAFLYENTHDDRLFADWSMGFEEAKRLDPEAHPGLNYFLAGSEGVESLTSNPDHDVFEFFSSFRQYVV